MDEFGSVQDGSLASNPQVSGSTERRVGTLAAIAPLAGLFAYLIVSQMYPPLDRTPFVGIAVTLFLAAVLLTMLVQRRIKRGADVESFFPFTTWVAFGPLLLSAILLTNGLLDHSPPEVHATVITRKWVSRGKSTSYHLEFASWRPNQSIEEVEVRYPTYARFHTGDRVTVELRKGALRIPWVGTISRTP